MPEPKPQATHALHGRPAYSQAKKKGDRSPLFSWWNPKVSFRPLFLHLLLDQITNGGSDRKACFRPAWRRIPGWLLFSVSTLPVGLIEQADHAALAIECWNALASFRPFRTLRTADNRFPTPGHG